MIAAMRALVLALLLVAVRAHAQPAATADQLFDRGDALARAGKYTEACSLFEQSFALEHAPGTELRLADCYEHLGQLVHAWRLFDAAAAQWALTSDSRAAFANQRRDALTARVAIIELQLPDPLPAGLTLKLGGKTVPVAVSRARTAVDPGKLTIEVDAPGRATFSTREDVTAGKTFALVIPQLAVAGGPAPAPHTDVVATEGGEPAGAGHKRMVETLAVGGAAVVSFAVAGGLTIDAYDKFHAAEHSTNCVLGSPLRCNATGQRAIDSAGTIANVATALVVVGVALGGATGWLYFTRPRDTLAVAPTATASSVGVTVQGRF
jgi:hypothetical protein